MKTIKKIFVQVILLASILLNQSTVTAQYCGPYIGAFRWEIQTTPAYPYLSFTVGSGTCTGSGTLDFPGMGINVSAPNYMLDILCDPTTTPPTNMDVNISSIAGGGFAANAVGYRIGDSMIIWHNGILSSVFVGVYAGGGGAEPQGPENTFVGNRAGRHNTWIGTEIGNCNTYLGFSAGYGHVAITEMKLPGDTNVFVGYKCGYNISTGSDNVFEGNQAGFIDEDGDTNVFIGNHTGFKNTIGNRNDFIGNYAGYSNDTGYENVFIGNRCGYSNTTANWNTFAGNHCGYSNVTGTGNSFYGKHAGFHNVRGNVDNFFGEHAGYNNTMGTKNCAFGGNSLWSNTLGDSNVVMGNDADYYGGAGGALHNLNVFIGDWAVPSFTSGDSNVFVGAKSDVNSTIGQVNNSGAFGYGAIVTASDKIILGNDTQDVGIGMSGLDVGVGPTNRLEISYFSASAPAPCTTLTLTSTFTATPCAGPTPTGASGLQFRDLNNSSFLYPNNPTSGFLTVDDLGNVILMQAPTGAGGIGTCSKPLTPAAGNDPTVDLKPNSNNFWFQGNGNGNGSTNVYIGYPCDTSSPPLAKLNVLQESGSHSTVCGYFENRDQGQLGRCGDAIIGIESLVDGPPVLSGYAQVAGWFQAGGATNCCLRPAEQYAIIVPKHGGVVSIGDPYATTFNVPCANSSLLSVYGTAWAYAWTMPSDSTLKTNVTPINTNNNALSVIQKLNGVSFNYVDSVISDSGMSGTHYGFIAQQVQRVLPNVVKTNNQGIEGVAYTEIIPWLVEGMKQQQGIIDSLKNVLNSIQNCLTTLCSGSGNAPVRHPVGNGNSGDSNATITNVQDVMLTAGANAPLLYQNIPNPFSTGTKINYYLPEGTQGATIMFYDTYGNQIKVVPLSQTGNGTLNITPDNLSAGIYSYSLVVNNTIIDTKRMLLQK